MSIINGRDRITHRHSLLALSLDQLLSDEEEKEKLIPCPEREYWQWGKIMIDSVFLSFSLILKRERGKKHCSYLDIKKACT